LTPGQRGGPADLGLDSIGEQIADLLDMGGGGLPAANPERSVDPDYFRREILPRLAKMKLADIMAVTGFSKSFASQIRTGQFTPHISTWAALAGLAEI
jgi:hypothetical protein